MSVKVGDKIRIIHMEGEPDYTYKEGIVRLIDDADKSTLILVVWRSFQTQTYSR